MTLLQKAFTLFKRTLASRGYQLRQIAPLDLRSTNVAPTVILMKESNNLSRPLTLDIPIYKLRNTIGTAFDNRNPHVLGITLARNYDHLFELLLQFYNNAIPTTPLEILGVENQMAPGFIDHHPLSFAMPWQPGTPDDRFNQRTSWMEHESIDFNYNPLNCTGFNHFGPASANKVRLETDRLTNLLMSIKSEGFQRSDRQGGDVTGSLLLQSNGSWCVHVRHGQHRTAVAAALGHNAIPVRFTTAPIKREDVDYWPQVVEGRITREGALNIFDRVMRGDPPQACRFDPALFVSEHPKAPGIHHEGEARTQGRG